MRLNKKEIYFLILSNALLNIHDFFRDRGLMFVDTSVVQKKYTDHLTHTIYFGKNNSLFLTPSNSLKLSALSCIYGNVYTITHAFRDDLNDSKHLSEFHLLEAEWKCNQLMDIYELLYSLVNFLIDKFNDYIEKLNFRDIKKKQSFTSKFINFDYEVLKKMFVTNGNCVDEITDFLASKTVKPSFLGNLPQSNSWRAKPGLSANLIFPHIGEVAEISIKETSYDFYMTKFTYLNFADEMKWFLDCIKENNEERGGFGFGIDRFVMWLLDIDEIDQLSFFAKEGEFYECL